MNPFTYGVVFVVFFFLHLFQLALGLAVCALYGTDLNAAHKVGKYQDGRWVFAVVIGGLSIGLAAASMVPWFLRFSFIWVLNVLFFILWTAVFGLFGAMYINENPEGNVDIIRMKNAVWVDLASMLLWLITSVAHFGYWWRHRERHTRFTGRANV